MAKHKTNELIRQFGMNPEKPDSFQIANEPLMTNVLHWSEELIDIHDVIRNLFNINVKTKLIATLLDLNPDNWVGIAASWNQNNHSGQIRIDTKLVEYLLDNAFGESLTNRPFSIKRLTELELNILQAFLGNIENKMKEHYEVDPKHVYLTDTIYLVWLIESQDGELGRVAFGLPASFKPKKVLHDKPIEIADLNKLANTGIKVPINLKVGLTKLALNEIKSLEIDDLLIFEESNTSKLYWHLGEIGIVLPEEDHPAFIKDVENIQELAKEMINKPKTNDEDPLSSLPLELSAEFQKVLIPLKQVLELKAGGVLPLGPVLDSELTLTAQGKPVAKGEIVIIGNQFGMRISELLISTHKALGSIPSSNVDVGEMLPQQPTRATQESNFADELDNLEEN